MNWDPTVEIRARLERDGSRGDFFCPSHDDETASLSCNPGADGRVLLRCHRRPPCDTAAILDAIGLKMRDLFPRNGENRNSRPQPHKNPPRSRAAAPAPKPPRRAAKELCVEPVELYEADGKYFIDQLRITLDSKKPNGKYRKRFSYRHPSIPNRRCTLAELGIEAADLPLWGSEKLREHLDRIVIVTEGIKAGRAVIAALVKAGWDDMFVVVATVAGAEVLPCADRLECLRDRVIWLWPDNDEGGRAHMADLECWTPAAETRTIMIEGLPEGGDAVDYFERGGTILGIVEAVR